MAFGTLALAVSAVGLWLLVWTKVQRNRRDAWVAGAERARVDVLVEVDRADPSMTGTLRQWVGIPRVNVYVSTETDIARLLNSPDGEPYALLIHLERPIPEGAISRIASRFPAAEVRHMPPSKGGLGGAGGNGYF